MPSGIDPIKLLLVEDSADDAELVLAALSAEFEVFPRRVENGAAMKKALDEESWDAVLSDFNLPEFSTVEALDILKSGNFDIPFIVVSGCIGEEAAVALMKSGAHDFVMKNNPGRLAPALKRELREAQVRRERGRLEADINRWAEVFRHAQWGVAIESADGRRFENMNPEFARMYGYEIGDLKGAALTDFFPPDCCQIPCCTPEERVWEATHVRRDGSRFPVLINVSEVMDSRGKTAYRVVNVQDITRLKETESALAASEARFHAMTNNVPGMVFQYRLDGTKGRFSYVSEGAAAICGLSPSHLVSDPDAFMALFSEADTKTFIAARDSSATALGAWNWEGRILLSGDHVKWINLRATPRRIEDGSLLWDGVLFNITDSKLKEEELRWSREMLGQLSAHRDTVREEERKSIAREIHDELGQALTALKIDVDWLSRKLPEEAGVGGKLHSMSKILVGTVDSVRRIAENLRPGMLDDLGLAAAIEWQVEQFGERTGINCDLAMNREEFDLDDRLATCVFRIIQEALTNVARHAGADRVEVNLAEANGKIELEVSDNGRGFQENPKKRSYGLLGMKERVKMLGGEVDVSSSPGRGTSVRVRLPTREAIR
ncbi:MAG: PAS domain-containing sensor histidine kinase [Burkholderiales bacterium]